jgi:Ca2+-binding EF-hand superfamily protein
MRTFALWSAIYPGLLAYVLTNHQREIEMVSVSGVGGSSAPQVMTGASARQPLSQKYNSVFSQLTTPGSGVLTRDQFTQAFSSLNAPASFQSLGAAAIFSTLDPNNTGSVSRDTFIRGLSQLSARLSG